jgi:hypothetical protein
LAEREDAKVAQEKDRAASNKRLRRNIEAAVVAEGRPL